MRKQNKLNIFLWTVPLVNSIGRSIYDVAFIWLILDITNSEKITGFVAMTTYLPAILCGLFVGSVVDLFPKTKIISFSTIMQGIVLLCIPILFYYNIQTVWLIMLLAFFHNGFALPMVPAFNAYLPTQIRKEKLLKANSIVNISWQTAVLVGPIIAAQLLTIYPVENLFLFCVLFYFLAAGLTAIAPKDVIEKEPINFHNILHKTKEGLQYLKEKATFRSIIILTLLSNLFVMGPAIVGIPIFIKLYLNGSAANFAMAEAFVGLGMLLGTSIMYKIGSRFNYGFLFILGLFIDGASFCLYYFVENLSQFYIFSFMHGIGIPFLIIARVTIMQKHIPEKLLGRIFSIISISILSMTAVSSGMIGIMAEFFEITSIFLIFGILAGLCGVAGLMHPKIRYLN
jgi:MFS family permease